MTRWVWIEDVRVLGEGCMGLIEYPHKLTELTKFPAQIPCEVKILTVSNLCVSHQKEHTWETGPLSAPRASLQ